MAMNELRIPAGATRRQDALATTPSIRTLARTWCELAHEALEAHDREARADAVAARLRPPHGYACPDLSLTEQLERIRNALDLPRLEAQADQAMGRAEAIAAKIVSLPADDVAEAAVKVLLLAGLMRGEIEPKSATLLHGIARDLARLATEPATPSGRGSEEAGTAVDTPDTINADDANGDAWETVDAILQGLAELRSLAFLGKALADCEDLRDTPAADALYVLADKIDDAARSAQCGAETYVEDFSCRQAKRPQ